MFKTIKRWCTNLNWLFNHPPISVVKAEPGRLKCAYCGEYGDVWYFVPLDWGYCMKCQKKVFDWVLIDSAMITKDKETGKVVHNSDK
jgi:hypothetical protein